MGSLIGMLAKQCLNKTKYIETGEHTSKEQGPYPENSPQPKPWNVDPTKQEAFLEQQVCYQVATQDKEKIHTEISVAKNPVFYKLIKGVR